MYNLYLECSCNGQILFKNQSCSNVSIIRYDFRGKMHDVIILLQFNF